MINARSVLSALLATLVASSAAHAQARSTVPAQAAHDAGVVAPSQVAPAVSAIEVVVMAGSHGPGGIAAPLRAYTQLARPPFSAFSQIDQVSRAQLALSDQSPATVAIPNNGALRIALASAGRGRRVSIAVTITLGGRTHQSQYSVAPGEPFFLVHSTGVDSALIVRFVPR